MIHFNKNLSTCMPPTRVPNHASASKTKHQSNPLLLTARELVERNWPEPPSKVEGLIAAGEVGLFIGQQKKGKSTLCRQLALAVAAGKPFLDKLPTSQGKVLYIDFENRPRAIKHSLLSLADVVDIGDSLVIQAYERISHRDLALSGKGLACLQVLVGEQQPSLLIIDPLRLALSAETSLLDDKHLVKIIDACQGLTEHVPDMSVVLVHHLKKKQRDDSSLPLHENPGDWIDRVFGGQALLAHVEFILGLEEQDEGYCLASVQRSQEERILFLDKHPDLLRFTFSSDQSRLSRVFRTAAQQDLWAKLPGKFSYEEGRKLAGTNGLLDRVINKARSALLLERRERGKYAKVVAEPQAAGD